MYNMLFFTILLSSILLSFMTKNWLLMWILMELNLISFLPLIMMKKNIKNSIKNSFYYFLIQSFSSMIFLFANLMKYLINNLMMMKFINLMILISILIKLAMFPFYNWYINLMNSLNWNYCFILSTMQKILPLMMLINLFTKNYKLILIINMMNSMFSTIGGLNQTFLKSLMAYSSINQISWMMIISIIMEKFFMPYMIMYMIISFSLMYSFNIIKINYINEIYLKKNLLLMKIMIMLNMLSLNGIPPMIGFMMKWMSSMIMKFNIYISLNMFILMISSTITMFYYLYLIIPTFMYFNIKNKLNFKTKLYWKLIPIFMFMSFFTMFNNFIY